MIAQVTELNNYRLQLQSSLQSEHLSDPCHDPDGVQHQEVDDDDTADSGETTPGNTHITGAFVVVSSYGMHFTIKLCNKVILSWKKVRFPPIEQSILRW